MATLPPHPIRMHQCTDPTANSDMQKWKLSRNMYTSHARFLLVLAPICKRSRCLLTKFLHRISVGSLLRVRCWLGRHWMQPRFPHHFLLSYPHTHTHTHCQRKWGGRGGEEGMEAEGNFVPDADHAPPTTFHHLPPDGTFNLTSVTNL